MHPIEVKSNPIKPNLSHIGSKKISISKNKLKSEIAVHQKDSKANSLIENGDTPTPRCLPRLKRSSVAPELKSVLEKKGEILLYCLSFVILKLFFFCSAINF